MKKVGSSTSQANIRGSNEEVSNAPRRSVVSALDVKDTRTTAVEEKIALSAVLKSMPGEVLENIMSLLDGPELMASCEVCREWSRVASEEHLWKAVCMKDWSSLATDCHLWKLVFGNVSQDDPNRWRKIYPSMVKHHPRWTVGMSRGKGVHCNLIGHQLAGSALYDLGLPDAVNISHRLNLNRLPKHVYPDCAVLYLEPATEEDNKNFKNTVFYLKQRERAGLAVSGDFRFLFIPPCGFSRARFGYNGLSLLCVVEYFPPNALN